MHTEEYIASELLHNEI